MVAVRLRHPKGISTINIPLDREDYTVQDLQQEIYAASGILPSRQNLKAGYPPRSLAIVPELSVTTLDLKSGEQIIVGEIAERTTSQPKTPARTSRNDGPVSTPPSSPDSVQTEGGMLIHRVVPDDNSCLFSAAALIFRQDVTKASEMRKIVAEGLRNDPTTYNEAILGMAPSQYITTILKPSTWGGAIELGILAAHYKTEIASIDVETGRIDHFSPQEDNGIRCIVVYSGIHYDAATLAPALDAPDEWHETIFPIQTPDEKDPILEAAKKLAAKLRQKKAYTNTATFDLKCEECGQGLKGEKDARGHAANTGHVRFGEY